MKAGQQKFPRLEILPDAQMRLCHPLGSVSGNGRERLYENICRRAGIQLTYCAEQFENDGPPNSTVLKSIKRAMAAEYSRQWPD